MIDKADRAPKGGTIGINGSSYDGGQFLPQSAMTIKGAQKTSKTTRKARKVEIANYEWAYAPTADHISIWANIVGIFAISDGDRLVYSAKPETLAYYGRTESWARDLVERWNAGERWFI